MLKTLTARFLGQPETWINARLRCDDVHGLWGGRVVYLSGAGQVVVQVVPASRSETRWAWASAPAAAQAVFARCAEGDVLAARWAPRPLVPDESQTRLTLVNAAGAQQSVVKLAHDPHAALAQIFLAAHHLADQAAHTAPLYQGLFDDCFQPAWF